MTTAILSEQRELALSKANATRSQRARLKRDLRCDDAGEARGIYADIFENAIPPWLATARLSRFLSWGHQMGPVLALRYMRRAGIYGDPVLGRLTTAQRHRLAATMREAQERR